MISLSWAVESLNGTNELIPTDGNIYTKVICEQYCSQKTHFIHIQHKKSSMKIFYKKWIEI